MEYCGQKGGEVFLDGRDDRHFLRGGNHGFLVFQCGLCPQLVHFPNNDGRIKYSI